jgi:hypothetical protein
MGIQIPRETARRKAEYVEVRSVRALHVPPERGGGQANLESDREARRAMVKREREDLRMVTESMRDAERWRGGEARGRGSGEAGRRDSWKGMRGGIEQHGWAGQNAGYHNGAKR